MHFSINITSLTYDGDNYITYNATLIRSDVTANVLNVTSQTVDIQNSINHEFEHTNVIYQRIASNCYHIYCTNFSLSEDPTNYVFLGLFVSNPYVLTTPELVLVKDI